MIGGSSGFGGGGVAKRQEGGEGGGRSKDVAGGGLGRGEVVTDRPSREVGTNASIVKLM
jgi:hypothetical protein